MCETRDLGIKWPHWQTLLFEGQVELKEGVWLDPIQALLRRKTHDVWTEKHPLSMRKLVVEGGWGAEKVVRHWRPRIGAAWLVAHGYESSSKHSSCMFGCGWTSGLPRHCCRDRNGTATQPCHPRRASAFSLGGSVVRMRTGSCTNFFGRHGSVSIAHSDSPSVAGGLYADGSMSSVVVTLMDLGWTPREPD